MPSLLAVFSGILQKRKSVNPTMVALLAEERDCAVLADICRRSHWNVSFANTCSEALALMDRVKAPILFIDRDLAGSDWRGAMASFASSSSRTCIMLISRVVDVYLWNEVVRYGGYEVLAKPLRGDDVSRAVRLAWSYWSTAARSSAAAKPFARR
jgi:DNA-binding NtrC family response regulator